MALKRLQKELNDMRNAKQNEIPENVSFGMEDGNIFKWQATLIGSVGTPYEGGIFKLQLNFSQNYPFVPPVVKFTTRIMHPNINRTGDICLDLLKSQWSPVCTVTHILLSIISLLSDPYPNDPLDAEVANLYKRDINEYNMRVREMTHLYAN